MIAVVGRIAASRAVTVTATRMVSSAHLPVAKSVANLEASAAVAPTRRVAVSPRPVTSPEHAVVHATRVLLTKGTKNGVGIFSITCYSRTDDNSVHCYYYFSTKKLFHHIVYLYV